MKETIERIREDATDTYDLKNNRKSEKLKMSRSPEEQNKFKEALQQFVQQKDSLEGEKTLESELKKKD